MLYRLVGNTIGGFFYRKNPCLKVLYNDSENWIVLVDPSYVNKFRDENWRNLYYGVFKFNKTCLIENVVLYPHNYYTFYGDKFLNKDETRLICKIEQLN